MSNELVSHLDIFPTILKLAGGILPDDRLMDGKDISDVLFKWKDDEQLQPALDDIKYTGKTQKNDSKRLFTFYCQKTLFAVRYGSFKFHFYTQNPVTKEQQGKKCGDGGFPIENNFDCMSCYDPQCTTQHIPPLMYNVDKDPNEAYPLNTSLMVHKIVLEEMMVKVEEFKSTLEKGPNLFDSRSDDVIPCCSPDTFPNCTCNY